MLQLVPLDRQRHDRASFPCGVSSLDRYFAHQLTQDVRRQIASVYVFAHSETGRIRGYHTLSAGSVFPDDLPPSVTKRLPRYATYPVALIGWLAVDSEFQRQRIGEVLLSDALSRASRLAEKLGILAVVVDALDERAAGYYRRFGPSPFSEDQLRLFLTVAEYRRLVVMPT